MTGFRYKVLAPLICESLEAYWKESNNWIADWRLAKLIRERHQLFFFKDDDVRRVASDLAKEGRIRKFPRKSLYKWREKNGR